ncbi:hypothetical protein BDW42DRAFT_182193, partial [Aspergillus taichungensis]
MTDQIFYYSSSFQILICRTCKHGVWPSELSTHLSHTHHFSKKAISGYINEISQWPALIQDPYELTLPQVLTQPVPILDIYYDGIQCQQS